MHTYVNVYLFIYLHIEETQTQMKHKLQWDNKTICERPSSYDFFTNQ